MSADASAEPAHKRPRNQQPPAPAPPVPITLLSGFLGAGKTTMLKHLLENKAGLKVGVVVNDVAEINIDASLVAIRGGGITAMDDTVELQNGCACCSAADELLQSVEKMMEMSEKRGVQWDHIVIEASGVAEPKEIRDNFRYCYESAPEMLRGTMLHTLVTVVDGSTFLSEFQKRNVVEQRTDLGANEFTDGNRQVVDLMCEQIEVADVIVINKLDLISPEEADLLKETISALAPLANILTSERGRVPLESILAAAKGGGIASLKEEQEHHKVVELVKQAQEARKRAASSGHEQGGPIKDPCKDPDCKDAGHEHEHAHGHEHAHAEQSGQEHEHGHKEKEAHGHGHEHGHGSHDDCSICKEGGSSHTHDHSHSHKKQGREAKRFGITSFCYQRRRPFHPARLMNVIRQLPVRQQQLAIADCLHNDGSKAPAAAASNESEKATRQPAVAGRFRNDDSKTPAAVDSNEPGVHSPMLSLIRSKGFVWLSNSDTQMFYWALAGKHFELKQYATWWSTMEEDEWPTEQKEIDEIKKDFEGEFGDHRQELVFIGVKMDEEGIVKLLDECLLSDEELNAYRQHWLS